MQEILLQIFNISRNIILLQIFIRNYLLFQNFRNKQAYFSLKIYIEIVSITHRGNKKGEKQAVSMILSDKSNQTGLMNETFYLLINYYDSLRTFES